MPTFACLVRQATRLSKTERAHIEQERMSDDEDFEV